MSDFKLLEFHNNLYLATASKRSKAYCVKPHYQILSQIATPSLNLNTKKIFQMFKTDSSITICSKVTTQCNRKYQNSCPKHSFMIWLQMIRQRQQSLLLKSCDIAESMHFRMHYQTKCKLEQHNKMKSKWSTSQMTLQTHVPKCLYQKSRTTKKKFREDLQKVLQHRSLSNRTDASSNLRLFIQTRGELGIIECTIGSFVFPEHGHPGDAVFGMVGWKLAMQNISSDVRLQRGKQKTVLKIKNQYF